MPRPLLHVTPRQRAGARVRRAFTLVELVVVVVLMGILAAAIVPQFVSTTSQEASVAVERLAELMRLFAYRDALSTQQVALWRNGEDGRVNLMVMDIDPERPNDPPDWRADRFALTVTLPRYVAISELRVNDQRLDPDEWLITSVPGGTRPKIEMRLAGGGVESTLVLPANSPSVVRVDAGQPDPYVRTPIDLNRAGRDREPW